MTGLNVFDLLQACRKAAKRAQKKSAQDRHLLLSQVETFLSKAGYACILAPFKDLENPRHNRAGSDVHLLPKCARR